MIAHASKLSERVQLLVSNNRQHIIKTNRDPLALAYWTIVFEHHNGILTLLRNGNPTSAYSLLRVLEEAFLKLFLVMFGTEKQLRSISNGEYNTDFVAVGKQIDEKMGVEPMVGPRFKGRIGMLHGLTHNGPEQVMKQLSKQTREVGPTYSDKEIRALVQETMPVVFMAGAFMTEFLNLPVENATALQMFDEYVELQLQSLNIDDTITKIETASRAAGQ
ncbi:MAG TPA: hypothetical protein VNE63_13625 [Candidatus Acidoferrales bacterium]|nr:hypothetical protein [Candidatus Acidoferrales bacterium]